MVHSTVNPRASKRPTCHVFDSGLKRYSLKREWTISGIQNNSNVVKKPKSKNSVLGYLSVT